MFAWQHALIDQLKPSSDQHCGATDPRSQDSTAGPANPGRGCHLISG
jgi:hypothetical protein